MRLSDEERNLLAIARRNYGQYHLATRWYFKGWDPLPYQYVWHHVPIGNTTWIAGIACVDGSTRILAPDGTETPVADLVGQNVDVVSVFGKEFWVATANPPLLKGQADLYRVVLSDGKQVIVTLDHKFLTPSGYVMLRNLSVGSLIGVLPTPDQTTRLSNVRHLTDTLQGLQDRCSVYCHQYDELPLLTISSDLVSFPLRDDAGVYNHSKWLPDDLQEREPKYNRLGPSSVRRSNSDYVVREVVPLSFAQYSVEPETFEHVRHSVRQSLLQSHNNLVLEALGLQPDLRVDPAGSVLTYDELELLCNQVPYLTAAEQRSIQNDLYGDVLRQRASFRGDCKDREERPQLDVTSFDGCSYVTSYRCRNYRTPVLYASIEKIEFVRFGDYYDIQVPDFNSYVANGIVHHNCGKTTSVTASYTIDCLTYPGFKALNASVTAKQAELSFAMLNTWLDHNPTLEKHIKDISLRPYPIVSFDNTSEFTFRTAGQGAQFIRGFEYDRINVDEPQLIGDEEAIRTLRGRLRGIRADGSPRMARLDCTGTPSYAVWLRERFEKGFRGSEYATPETLKLYWSMRTATYDNTKLTAEQIKLMEADYPPDLIEVELKGNWPDYGLSMFPIKHVMACVDGYMNDEMDVALHPDDPKKSPEPGYDCIEWPRVGEIKMEFPFDPRGIYLIAGDPGVDSPPKRNAGVVMVARIDPSPAGGSGTKELVYFHWVPGGGSYHPFMQSYKYAMQKYAPIKSGIDATGPQKALDELGFQDFGLVLDNMNFGALKDAMLNALLVDITSHSWKYPRIQGLIKQLSTYRREDDTPSKMIPQDVLMTLAMLSWLARAVPAVARDNSTPGANYRNRRARSSVASRRR